MDRVLSIVVALLALGLMARWGVRSARLRREHGPPPPGNVRRIFLTVTAGYVIAGGMLVWWLLGDLITPGWVQLILSLGASVLAFRAGIGWVGFRKFGKVTRGHDKEPGYRHFPSEPTTDRDTGGLTHDPIGED